MYLATRDDGAAVLVQPHSVRLIPAAGRNALTKLGLPVAADRLTDAELAAITDAMGAGPYDPSGDLAALAKTLAAVAAGVAKQADDETQILGAETANTAKVLGALQQIIVSPGTDHLDPRTVIAALRDALVRGEPPAAP